MNFNLSIIIAFISSLILNMIVMKYGYLIGKDKSTIQQIQDIHEGFVSRLGGLIIVIIFFNFNLFYKDDDLLLFYVFSSMILLPALLEDLGYKIKALYRFFFILIGSFLIVTVCIEFYPQFDFGKLNIIANNHFFQVIFFTFALATVINGQNIIDGTNGLSASTSLVIYSCLLHLGMVIQSEILITQSILIIALLTSFLIFNYPYGKIFLGDMGSYFLGLYAGYLVIDTYGQNSQLSAWSAVTILFYPTLEVLFSYYRKIKSGRSPFLPDNEHLHLKLYFLISKNSPMRKLYNALVTPFLSIIWLSPLVIFSFSIYFPHYSLIALLGLIFMYLFFYYAIPKANKN